MGIDGKIRVEDHLSFEGLQQLLRGDVVLLRIPKFYATSSCESLSTRVMDLVKTQSTAIGKIYESDVDSFFNTIGNADARARYLETAIPNMRRLRRLSDPYICPSDLLRIELDEVWRAGASLMRVDGKPMFFGIARLWSVGSEGLPHQDVLLRELPDERNVVGQSAQLGANVYIQVADSGGELEVWDHSFTIDECRQYGIKGSYGFERALLPSESVVVAPRVGDLILINTFKVHAIRKTTEGTRLTISGFVGYWEDNKSLRLWS